MSGIEQTADAPASFAFGRVIRLLLAPVLVIWAVSIDALLIRNLVNGWPELPNGGTPGGERVLLALGAVPLVLAVAGIVVGCWRRWPVRRTAVLAAVLLGGSALGAILLHEALFSRLYST